MVAYNETAISLLAAAARGAGGTGTAVDLGTKTLVRLALACSAVSGTATPKLNVYVETSLDDVAWTVLSSFTERTAAGTQELWIAGCSRYLRVRWTITGTGPSFTFGVNGSSFVAYCTPTALYQLGIPQRALADITAEAQAKAIKVASEDMDGRFNDRYEFPLVAWSADLERHTAGMAAFILLTTRGTSLDGQDWEVLNKLNDNAVAWGKDVGAKKINPPGIVDSTPTVDEAGPCMYTNTKRGW